MTIVIDASVAVKWVIREPGSEAADAILEQTGLVAPAIWIAEAASALWRRARIGEITAEEASERLAELQNAPLLSVAMEAHMDRSLDLAMQLGHPIYDCLYLALALHYDSYVVTADRRFIEAANPFLSERRVRLLGEIS